MNDYTSYLLIFFFVVSNVVAFYNIYKRRLRYLPPSRGYLFSILLIFTFIAVDYSVYSFAVRKERKKVAQEYTHFYVENAFNKLADSNILEQDKDLLADDLKLLFIPTDGLVSILSEKDSQNVNRSPVQLSIDAYLHQLRTGKSDKVVKVKALKVNELGRINFVEVTN